MGKKKEQSLSTSTQSLGQSDGLISTLGDFTKKENWDKFFTLRSADEAFEWYAEWPELEAPLLSAIRNDSNSSSRILVPGCGNSQLSEHLFDAGFQDITNIDFSKVVITDMLRRNVRERPAMRWRVMDMTSMQFEDESFDVVLDKGGLDALMEPEHGTQLGTQYLSEVKRVLVCGGKFICLSLAESHVIGLLLSKHRVGWKTTIHTLLPKSPSNDALCTFMIVSEKEDDAIMHSITKSFSETSLNCQQDQAAGFMQTLERENQIRLDESSVDALQPGYRDFELGRRVELTLGGHVGPRFTYKAVLLDATDKCRPFSYQFGVFIVPKSRAREWLFSSEEGQWLIVESSKAARLLMVILDSSHSVATIDEIKSDLSPLVTNFSPRISKGEQIPFLMASDGIKERKILYEGKSKSTGSIVIEDVVYENSDSFICGVVNSKEPVFRRLVFKRTENLVQSEAVLVKEDVKKVDSTSKIKKKASKKLIRESLNGLMVFHHYLASSYHIGIISGFSIVVSYLQTTFSNGNLVNVIVIGLGAGLLPMFLRHSLPFLHIDVIELDGELLALGTKHFGFEESDHLKVHTSDGIEYIDNLKIENKTCASKKMVDIVVVDVDSSDASYEMACPAPGFVEESFLLNVRETLTDKGMFVVNLVTRSHAVKNRVISKIKEVFGHMFSLQLDEELNLVLFALKSKPHEKGLLDASEFVKLCKMQVPQMTKTIIETASKIQYIS